MRTQSQSRMHACTHARRLPWPVCAAQIRVAHTMKKSTDMMRSMNNLIKVPELMGTMRRMSEEMSKAGIMEEMITDAMDAAAPEGLEDEADELTEAVLFEVTDGVLGKAPSAPIAGLPTRTAAPVAGAGVATGRVAVAEGADDADLASLRDQLGKI
ncbi:hypothetical protein EON67_05715 [archaeon]|nr:MAG: hypothetical protein EON67_05715 [archaeon]